MFTDPIFSALFWAIVGGAAVAFLIIHYAKLTTRERDEWRGAAHYWAAKTGEAVAINHVLAARLRQMGVDMESRDFLGEAEAELDEFAQEEIEI